MIFLINNTVLKVNKIIHPIGVRIFLIREMMLLVRKTSSRDGETVFSGRSGAKKGRNACFLTMKMIFWLSRVPF